MIEVLNGTVETVICTECKSVKLFRNKSYEDYPLHWHLTSEIITPLSNFYTAVINNQTINIGPGETLIIAQGELHQLSAPPTGERIILQFDLSLIQNIGNFESILPFLHPFILIPKDDVNCSFVKNIMMDILELYSSDDILKESVIYSKLIQLYASVCEKIVQEHNFTSGSSTSLPKQSEYTIKFMQICNEISNNCQMPLTLEEAAESAGFSKFHFSRLFKQFTGFSYYDYLNDCRVKKAVTLLIMPGISITDVAMGCGFNSLSTFNRVFKKYKNCTPSEYKNFYYSRMKGDLNEATRNNK